MIKFQQQLFSILRQESVSLLEDEFPMIEHISDMGFTMVYLFYTNFLLCYTIYKKSKKIVFLISKLCVKKLLFKQGKILV